MGIASRCDHSAHILELKQHCPQYYCLLVALVRPKPRSSVVQAFKTTTANMAKIEAVRQNRYVSFGEGTISINGSYRLQCQGMCTSSLTWHWTSCCSGCQLALRKDWSFSVLSKFRRFYLKRVAASLCLLCEEMPGSWRFRTACRSRWASTQASFLLGLSWAKRPVTGGRKRTDQRPKSTIGSDPDPLWKAPSWRAWSAVSCLATGSSGIRTSA